MPPQPSANEPSSVPLPSRFNQASQHQLALLIRDGRRAAARLVSSGEASKTTESLEDSLSPNSDDETSMSTALEKDFTVEGKKGNLQCPFSSSQRDGVAGPDQHGTLQPAPHHSDDPICAAMDQDSLSPSQVAQGSKCPIRYMNKHSPEEIAHYVETHKHELPRSHEVCLRRYQRSEEQMKKLDHKYGDIVSMIEDLSQLHKPMLPEDQVQGGEDQYEDGAERHSNERVENWARGVPSDPQGQDDQSQPTADRESRFDRPLKEIRVGESPSRPWGISVPMYAETSGPEAGRPPSPPPAPVRMLSNKQNQHAPVPGVSKCPIDHSKLASARAADPATKTDREARVPSGPLAPEVPKSSKSSEQAFFVANPQPPTAQSKVPKHAFVRLDAAKAPGGVPQMVFTGPVFIGYPMDQAIQFLSQHNGNAHDG